jgi:hypothetical protein
MSVPFNVLEEISRECAWAAEGVNGFSAKAMAMVAFACFVVVAQHALALGYIGEAVLEKMRTALQRLWELPDHQFSKCGIPHFDPLANQ